MIFAAPKLTEAELEVLNEIATIRKSLKHSMAVPRRWSGLLRRNTLARAIRGSNSIEGYIASVEDVIAAVEGEEPNDIERDTWLAVVGYRNAMTFVLQISQDQSDTFRYSEGYIRSLHYMMTQHDLTKHPGNWRPGAIFVRDEQQKKIVYEAPDREQVDSLMAEFLDDLNRESDIPQMVKAAMAHLNLVMIHPFSDGNGRMARCLQTLVLGRDGILEPQFCSVEEYLGHFQQDYYDILAKMGQGSWHPENDTLPWVRFMLRAHHSQGSLLAWRLKLLGKLYEEIEIELKRRGLHERLALALADAAVGLRVRNASYRHLAGVSDNLASRDLKTLVDEGLMKGVGENRGRAYVASEKLLAMRDRLYEPFRPQDPFTKRSRAVQPMLPGMV